MKDEENQKTFDLTDKEYPVLIRGKAIKWLPLIISIFSLIAAFRDEIDWLLKWLF